MDTKVWSSPVKFETNDFQFRIVASTEEASDFLLNHWRVEGGEKYLLARRACIDALGGAIEADVARQAFIEACKEANMNVEA